MGLDSEIEQDDSNDQKRKKMIKMLKIIIKKHGVNQKDIHNFLNE